jgi:Zn-dependent protease
MFRFQFLPREIARLLAEPAFVLGSLGGVRVRVHASALFTFVIAAVSLAHAVGPVVLPGVPLAAGAFAAVLVTLAFVSVGAHELARAAAVGGGEARLTLFLLGAHAEGAEPQTPRAEAKAAAAGLLASGALTALAAWTWRLAASAGAHPALTAGAALVAVANAGLLVVHVLPVLPLDGGRMLRSALWAAGADRRRATWLASRSGRWFALGIIAAGASMLMAGYALGLVPILVGWFVGESSHGTAAAARAALVQRFRGGSSGGGAPASSPFGPERAVSRHVRKPAAASTTRPGTLASAPKEPPVQSGASSRETSRSADGVDSPLTGTDQSSASDQFHPA